MRSPFFVAAAVVVATLFAMPAVAAGDAEDAGEGPAAMVDSEEPIFVPSAQALDAPSSPPKSAAPRAKRARKPVAHRPDRAARDAKKAKKPKKAGPKKAAARKGKKPKPVAHGAKAKKKPRARGPRPAKHTRPASLRVTDERR